MSPRIEDRLAREPVDPDTRRQREEQEREELDGAQQRDLERARVEDEDRGERDRELRDLRPELADRLPPTRAGGSRGGARAHRAARARTSGVGSAGSGSPSARDRRAELGRPRGASSIGSGISRRWRCGEKMIQRNASPPPIAPTTIVSRRPIHVPSAPPSSVSDRDRAPDDEAHHRVHPPLQPRRADRLPVADLDDVVDDDREARTELARRRGTGMASLPAGREGDEEHRRAPQQPDGDRRRADPEARSRSASR